MVQLIEQLHRIKNYKIYTLYEAVSLADRYLVTLAVKKEKTPCLAMLAVTCLLMAVKLLEPVSPNFNRMINLLEM